MLYLYELSLESPGESSPLHERFEEMFDIFFIFTIMATMYISWYSYKAPSGVSRWLHAIAAASAACMTFFFAYFMVGESPVRPQYHMVLVCVWYFILAIAYATFYYKGCIKERERLQGRKSR